MSTAMPIVFNTTAVEQSNNGFVGSASLYVNPTETVVGPTYYTDYKLANNNWAVVLDRNDPTKPALFNARLASNTDVPGDLANAMKQDCILFFMCASYSWQIPQGDLFTLLQENGAGGELQKLERYAYFCGCGMTWHGLYNLISVPGSGLPGIEKTQTGYLVFSTNPPVNSNAQLGISTLLSMVPGANGYMPVEVG